MQRRSILLGCLATATLAGVVWLAIGSRRAAAPRRVEPAGGGPAANATEALPVLWQVPAFTFPDQHRRPTTPADLRGHVWIANFIFTQCTTQCPLITAKMALLQRRLRGEGLRFVSFSVDPAHDTPDVLKRYAAGWRAGESRWTLLSTTAAALESLASAMYVTVKPAEKDIDHTRLFFLVDVQGGVRGIYESDKNDAMERLVRDTEALAGALPAQPSPRDEATTGAEVYAALGCGACHARRDLAPPLEGLQGRRVELEGGVAVHADTAYVRESIVAPDAKVVAGYTTRMPSYERELTQRQLDALVEYVGTLVATARPANEPAQNVTDPVCAMKVRVVGTTPATTHAGQTYHFCSERCRDRFVAEPARYLKLAAR
jgi:protein SCO1